MSIARARVRLSTVARNGRRETVFASLLLGCAFACPGEIRADAISEAAFNAKGFNPNREYISELPFEHIDPMTGNLLLTFTDLTLPGNAGFDLRIQRTYNSKIYSFLSSGGSFNLIEDSWAGLGWTLHLGRVVNPDSVEPGPVIEMPDGSQHPTFRHLDGNSSHFITRDFWTYEKLSTSPVLRLPNGIKYTFGHVAALNGATNAYRYVTLIEDPFGNTVAVNYYATDPQDPTRPAPGDAIQNIVQTLATGETRTVSFTYESTLPDANGNPSAAGSVRTMSLDGTDTAWTYSQKRAPYVGYTLFTTAQAPEGPAWTFTYREDPSVTPYLIVNGFTMPSGGQILYTFTNTAFMLGSGVTYSPAVTFRNVSGVQNQGQWSYFYTRFTPDEQTTDEPAVLMTDPCGFRSLHSFYDIEDGTKPWRLGALHRAQTGVNIVAGQIQNAMHTENLEWIASAPISNVIENFNSLNTHVPLLQNRTIIRREQGSPRSYQTTYAYDQTPYSPSRQNNFSDYGRAHTIVEAGDLSRTTTRDFFYGPGGDPSFEAYVVDMLGSETTHVGDEFFTRTFDYDAATGFKTRQTIYGIATTFEPGSGGNVAVETDANQHTTRYDYAWGLASNVHTPEYTILRTINLQGTVGSETRRVWNGKALVPSTTTYFYDPLLRLIRKTPPVGNSIDTTYDPLGHFVQVARGSSRTTSTFDGLGRVISTADTVGVNTASVYDACGRLTFESYPFSGTFSPTATPGTRFQYDALQRITRRTSPDNTSVAFSFENTGAGARTIVTDEKNHQTTQDFRAFGAPDDRRLVALIDADSFQTQYAYNALGQLTTVAPPGFSLDSPFGTRRWVHNERGQLVSETHPEFDGAILYEYDAVGNLMTRRDPAFGATSMQYDGNNRLRFATHGDAYDTEFRYDGADHRTLLANRHVSSEFAYDAGGRLKSRTDRANGQALASTYAYNANDRLSKIEYPTGGQVAYSYDSENRIKSVTNPTGSGNFATAFAYHPSGAVTSFKSGNGILNAFTYEPLTYRVKNMSAGTNASVLGLSYSYDNVGNVAAIGDARGTTWNQVYGYDNLDRMTTASGVWGPGGTFGYDSQGNRRTENIGGRSRSYSYDAQNRLRSYVGTDSFSGFDFDPNGNTLRDVAGAYTYARTNLMETTTTEGGAGGTTTYRYDADDQRTVKVLPNGEVRYYARSPEGQLLSEMRQPDPLNPRSLESVRDYIYAGSRLIASIKPAVYVVSPPELVFTAVTGSAAPPPQSLAASYTPPASKTWTATSSAPWLTLSAASGATPATVTASANPETLAEGVYTATITFTAQGNPAGSPQLVSVLLSITPGASLFVNPSSLTFSMQRGLLGLLQKQLQIAYGGDSVPWQATTNASWLSLSQTNGTTPASLFASANGQGYTEGTYSDTLILTSDGTPGSPKIVPVELVIQPPGGNSCDPADWYCEPFDALIDGPLGGQGGWVTSTNRTTSQVTLDPRGTGKAILIDPPAGTINEQVVVPDHPIDETEISFHVMTTGTAPNVKEVAKIEFYTDKEAWGKTKRTFGALRFGAQLLLQYGPNIWQPLVDSVESNRWYAIRVSFSNGEIKAFVDGVEKFATANPLAPGHSIQAFVITGWNLRGSAYLDMIEAKSSTPLQLVVEPPALAFTNGGGQGVYFEDDFTAGFDPLKWNLSIATSGSRWCGVWQTDGCGVSSHGTITSSGGLVTLSSGLNPTTPYVWAGPPSRSSPFPPSGDFSLEWRARFDTTEICGQGIVSLDLQNSDPVGTNNPDPASQRVMGLWGDSSDVGATMRNLPGQSFGPNDHNFHTLHLDSINGTYSFTVDGALLGQVSSAGLPRPTTIRVGHWLRLSGCTWSTLTLDYVRVTAPSAPPVLSHVFTVRDSIAPVGPDWQATVDVPWISLDASSGSGPSTVTATADPTGLSPGAHAGTITITADGYAVPQVVQVNLTVE